MKNKKRYLVASAALAGMFLIGSIVRHPASQARGAYATPVQVMNTTSAPGSVLDADTAQRIPYESTVTGSNCPTPGTAGACFFSFAGVPTGYRLVAENLSGYFQVSPSATAALVGYVEDGNPTFKMRTSFTAPIGQIDQGGHPQAAFDNPTRFYVDGGKEVFAVASSTWSNGTSTMILSGYLQNCSIFTGGVCPPVQN